LLIIDSLRDLSSGNSRNQLFAVGFPLFISFTFVEASGCWCSSRPEWPGSGT